MSYHGCTVNCGSTDCEAPVYVTCTETPKCKHANGWHVTVRFWFFKRRLFVCSDCGEALPQNVKGEPNTTAKQL